MTVVLHLFFSENVTDVSNNNITIYDASNSVVEIIDVSSVNVSIVDNEVIVNPTNDLSYNTSYYVNIDAGAFVDNAGFILMNTTEEEPVWIRLQIPVCNDL